MQRRPWFWVSMKVVTIWAHPYCPWHTKSQLRSQRRQKSWLPAWHPVLRRLFLKLKSSSPSSFLMSSVALRCWSFCRHLVELSRDEQPTRSVYTATGQALLASSWAGPMVWRFCIELLKKKIHLLLFSSRFLKHFDILVVPQYGENNIFILWHCLCQIL